VGGIMMLEGLKALQEDPKTKVIALVSKPPSNSVAKKILNQVAFGDKPTVVGFMGLRGADWDDIPNAIPAATLEETALIAAALAQKKKGDPLKAIKQKEAELAERAKHIQGHLNDNQRYLRGLFAGGTLCYEAEVIWRDHLKEPVNSNVPLDKKNKLADSMKSKGHTAVDLGEEEFTVGRPHPMIDNDLRIRRLMQEAQDPEVAVIMMDVVLGYGAHNDPSSELAPAAQRALELAKKNGRDLFIISSITGTEQDPQGLKKQTEAIAEAGIIVCDSNAEASRLVGLIVNSSGGK
jgi:FdrA protein